MNNKTTTTRYDLFARLSESEILSQEEMKPLFVPYEENIYFSSDSEIQAHWARLPDESKKEYINRLKQTL